jgi:glycosyltransferase involved in cell wall biosynthesis
MKKKICFLMDSIFSIGGVQRVTAVIAKELAKDYDVTIVTLDKEETMDTSLYSLNEANIHYQFFTYPNVGYWKWRLYKVYSYLYRRILPHTRLTSDGYVHSSFPSEKRNALAEKLKNGNYDVIIGVHAPLAVRLAACKKSLGKAKLIGWVHNSHKALFGKDSLYIGPELCKHYEYQLEKLDETIVLCHDDANKYHFPTKVIYNPLTLIPGTPSDGTSKKFLAVGRFSRRHKGFDLLIEAFNIFAKKNKEWTLDIVGEGVEEPMYRQLIKKYELEDRITIHPFTNHIQSYYREAQIYVLSSRWEGFGLVLVEAMAHGLPVISSDLPTSKEIMGNFGLYYKNGDIKALARQMEQATLLDWPSKSKEAITIAKQFDIGNIIQQWHQLLNSPVSSKEQ